MDNNEPADDWWMASNGRWYPRAALPDPWQGRGDEEIPDGLISAPFGQNGEPRRPGPKPSSDGTSQDETSLPASEPNDPTRTPLTGPSGSVSPPRPNNPLIQEEPPVFSKGGRKYRVRDDPRAFLFVNETGKTITTITRCKVSIGAVAVTIAILGVLAAVAVLVDGPTAVTMTISGGIRSGPDWDSRLLIAGATLLATGFLAAFLVGFYGLLHGQIRMIQLTDEQSR